MNDKILLSICIPTYNRADYLKKCLDNIVCQFNDEVVKKSVEIVISDNASQDNTFELVKNYQKSFENIKYFSNQINVGLDKNVINSVLKSTGKYCWNIGDDDLIQNGSLKFIVSLLSKKELALLTVDFYPFIDAKRSLEEDKGIKISSVIYSNSAEDFYNKGYCQGILGIFIFNKDLWLKIDIKNYEKYWPYYEIILKIIGKTNLSLAYLKYPVLFIGQDYRWNDGGAALFIAIHIKRVFEKLKNFGYSENFINKEVNGFAKNLVKTVLKAKASSLDCSINNLSLIYREFYKYPFQLFITTMIFFIPNNFIKTLKSFKNYF